MIHRYTIQTNCGQNQDQTILFCSRCGRSYVLVFYEEEGETPSKTVWELMPFLDFEGHEVQELVCYGE